MPGQCAVLGAWPAAYVLVRRPVSGVGRLNGSLLGCLRKDVALVRHCVLGLGRGTKARKHERTEVRKYERGRRHISCAPSRVSGLGRYPLA
ncbi:MAG TPA: hypothetical protein VIM51_14670 [Desulfosporosinus sp.]